MTNREIIECWLRANMAKVGTPEAPTFERMMVETGLNHAEIIIACDEHNKAPPPWTEGAMFKPRQPEQS